MFGERTTFCIWQRSCEVSKNRFSFSKVKQFLLTITLCWAKCWVNYFRVQRLLFLNLLIWVICNFFSFKVLFNCSGTFTKKIEIFIHWHSNLVAYRARLSFLDQGSRMLYSICPGQVVNLKRNIQYIVPKKFWYSLFYTEGIKGWVNLVQPGVKLFTCNDVAQRAEH